MSEHEESPQVMASFGDALLLALTAFVAGVLLVMVAGGRGPYA